MNKLSPKRQTCEPVGQICGGKLKRASQPRVCDNCAGGIEIGAHYWYVSVQVPVPGSDGAWTYAMARVCGNCRVAGETETCSRCGGSGRYSYCQTHGDTCFKCSGSGLTWLREPCLIAGHIAALGCKPGSPFFGGTIPWLSDRATLAS